MFCWVLCARTKKQFLSIYDGLCPTGHTVVLDISLPARKHGRSFFFFFNLFIYLLAVLGLHCCAWAFSSCGEQGLFFVAVHRLLTAVASLCCRAPALGTQAQQLWLTGSRAQAQ